jgi:purine-binding chemotaxis protein CheW
MNLSGSREAMMMRSESASQQFLSFALGDEVFAVNVLQVKEILDVINITRVPQMPDYMLGVINLRGSVVPVVDLRCKFGMEKLATSQENCIVVLEVDFDGERVVIGALTDAVREVLDLAADEIEPPPRLGMKLKSDFIRGMGKQGESFIIILDIDKIFSDDELCVMQGAESAEGQE